MILKEDCIFCQIVSGKIPADRIKESDNFIVIRDINPVAPVHLLIISKRHYDSVMEAGSDAVNVSEGGLSGRGGWGGGNEIFWLLGSLAKEFKADGKGFRTVINTGEDGGQTVQHLHIHFLAGRGFGWPPG